MTVQSGILSAVGMCIESQWGKVPLTTNQVGVTGTNPHRFCTVEGDGGFPARIDMNIPYDEVDGSISLKRTILQAKDYDGGFSMKADPEILVYPLLGIMGQINQTDLGAGSGGNHVFKHTFNPYVHFPSFTVEEAFGDKSLGRLTSGYILNMFELQFARTIMARIAGYSMHQIPNEYPTLANVDTQYDFTSTLGNLPWQMNNGTEGTQVKVSTTRNYVDVYPAGNGNGPLVYAKMKPGSITGFDSGSIATSGMVKINDVLQTYNQATGTGLKLQEGFTVSVAREITPYHVAMSGWDIGACVTGAARVGGNATFLYENNVVPLAALSKSKISINFKILGINIGLGGYAMEVHIPRARFLDPGMRNPATGGMTIPGDFVAELDASLGYEILISLWDTFDVSTLGGTEGGSPGGGGGAVIVAA